MIISAFSSFNWFEIFLITSLATCLWYYLVCGGLYLFLVYNSKKVAKWKTQMIWPSKQTAWKELRDGTIATLAAALNISLSIYFANKGWNKLYGTFTQYSLSYTILSFVLMFLAVETFEWWFHWFSHKNRTLWKIHKDHHYYPNPSPLAVMSDHPLDMWVKSSPLLWIPFLFPILDTTLVGWFTFVNFFYGIYLHAGFEFPYLPSRNSKYLVSSWHHNVHHSLHIAKNFGFFTGILDICFGTRYCPEDESKRQHRVKTAKATREQTFGQQTLV